MQKAAWLIMLLLTLVLTGCNASAPDGQRSDGIAAEANPTAILAALPTATVDLDRTLDKLTGPCSLTFQETQSLSRWLEDQRPVNKFLLSLASPGPTMTGAQGLQLIDAGYKFQEQVEAPFRKKVLNCKLAQADGWIVNAGKAYEANDGYGASIYMYDPYSDFLPQRPSETGYEPSDYSDLELVGLTAEQAGEMQTDQQIEFSGDIKDIETDNGVVMLTNVQYKLLPGGKEDAIPTVTADDLKSLRIDFSRTPCYGECPVYKLTIEGNGSVLFTGNARLPDGEAHETISQDQVQDLIDEFNKVGFFNMADDYPSNTTDLPGTCICIQMGNRSKCVSHEGGSETAPRRLSLLEIKIDQIANTAHYIK